jgi:hypothetical protein
VIQRHVIRLAYVVAAANALAAALTAFVPDVLNGPAFTNGNARGTALVMLLVATPLLLLALRRAGAPDASRAVLVVLGALAYYAYNDVLLLFATPFNRLFLVYTTAFGLTIFTSIEALRTIDVGRVAAALEPLPRRAIAIYAWLIVGLNTLGWLGAIVPAMTAADPTAWLADLGVATNPIYVQDLSFWLPGAAIAAWLLWRGRPAGVLLIGAWLVYGLVESIGVATDQWFGMQADPSVDATAPIALFIGLAIVGLVPLWFYLRPRRSGAIQARVAAAR